MVRHAQTLAKEEMVSDQPRISSVNVFLCFAATERRSMTLRVKRGISRKCCRCVRVALAVLVLMSAQGSSHAANRAKKARERQLQCGESFEDALRSAERFKKSRDMQMERMCLERALEIEDEAVLPMVRLADLQHSDGKLSQAMELLEMALQLDPHSTAAHGSAGSVLYTLRRIPESIGHFNRAVEGDVASASENLPQLLNNLGLGHAAQRDYTQAARVYTAALRLLGGAAPAGGRAASTSNMVLSILLNRGNAFVEARSFKRGAASYRSDSEPLRWAGSSSAARQINRPAHAQT